MVSSEWGAPNLYSKGLDLQHVQEGKYGEGFMLSSMLFHRLHDVFNSGRHLNVFEWSTGKLLQRLDLGEEGVMPLELRFLHDPKATEGFVGCALFAKVQLLARKVCKIVSHFPGLPFLPPP